MKRVLFVMVTIAIMLTGCAKGESSAFVQVKDGHFLRDGKPYYFVGTNFWYGASWAVKDRGATATDWFVSWIT